MGFEVAASQNKDYQYLGRPVNSTTLTYLDKTGM